jgi:hypothetical protein
MAILSLVHFAGSGTPTPTLVPRQKFIYHIETIYTYAFQAIILRLRPLWNLSCSGTSIAVAKHTTTRWSLSATMKNILHRKLDTQFEAEPAYSAYDEWASHSLQHLLRSWSERIECLKLHCSFLFKKLISQLTSSFYSSSTESVECEWGGALSQRVKLNMRGEIADDRSMCTLGARGIGRTS